MAELSVKGRNFDGWVEMKGRSFGRNGLVSRQLSDHQTPYAVHTHGGLRTVAAAINPGPGSHPIPPSPDSLTRVGPQGGSKGTVGGSRRARVVMLDPGHIQAKIAYKSQNQSRRFIPGFMSISVI